MTPSLMRFVVSEGTRSLLRRRVSAVRDQTHRLSFIGLDSDNHIHNKIVIALDTSPTRLSLARHNAQIYGVADRIEFILADYISFAAAYTSSPHPSCRKIDVVFLSPPWGGPSYLSGTPISPPPDSDQNPDVSKTGIPLKMTKNVNLFESDEPDPTYSLSSIRPIHGADLFRLSRKITKNIAYYLPRNTRLEDISGLLIESDTGETAGVLRRDGAKNKGVQKKLEDDEEVEVVEVEEEWMGSKLKALTCYFGGLAAGQEALFDA